MSKQYIGSQQHWEDSVNADYDRREQEAKDYEKEMNRQMEKQMFEQANNPMKQYTYNKQANKLIEQASMVHPELDKDNLSLYNSQMGEYLKHLASLLQIDCSPQCREVWEDGHSIKESEFELQHWCIGPESTGNTPVFICKSSYDLFYKSQTCHQCMLIAYPIHQ